MPDVDPAGCFEPLRAEARPVGANARNTVHNVAQTACLLRAPSQRCVAFIRAQDHIDAGGPSAPPHPGLRADEAGCGRARGVTAHENSDGLGDDFLALGQKQGRHVGRLEHVE